MAGSPAKARSWRLTREGTFYVGISFCVLGSAFIQDVNLLLLVFALMISPLMLGAWWCRKSLRALEARRFLSSEIHAGRPFTIDVEVRNGNPRRSVHGLYASDSLDPNPSQFRPLVLFPSIPPGAVRRRSYRAVMQRRGVHAFGRLVLASRFPLGFVEWRRHVTLPGELVVFPKLGTLHRDFSLVMGVPQDLEQTQHVTSRTNPDEFHSLREFRENDNPRHIHWRTTARRGELMVKEFEPAVTWDTLLVVDPWLPANPTAKQLLNLEKSFSFAATVCVHLSHRPNCRVVLAVAGERPSVRHGHGSGRMLEEFLTLLARGQGTESPSIEDLFQSLPPIRLGGLRIWGVSTRSTRSIELALDSQLGGRRASVPIRIMDVSSGELDPYFVIEGNPAPADRTA